MLCHHAKTVESHDLISHKAKSGIAGFVSGATAGVAKGLMKTHHTKQVFIPVKPEEPKYRVEYVSQIKPVLVREYPKPQQTQLYMKKEIKSVHKPKKSLLHFVKGFIKGKIIGKTVTKAIVH